MSPCRCGTPREDITWTSEDTRWAAATGRGSAGTQSLSCCPQLGGGQGEGWDRLSQWHAGSQELLSWSCGSSCWLPAHPAAPLSSVLQAGQALGVLARLSPLMRSCSIFLFRRREQQQQEEEEDGAALALCRCPGARAGGLQMQQGALWTAPGSTLREGRLPAPAHPGKPAWAGRGSPALLPAAPEGRWVSPGAPGMGDWALHPKKTLLVPAPLAGVKEQDLGQCFGHCCWKAASQPSNCPPAPPAGDAGCPAVGRTVDRRGIPKSCQRDRVS